MLICPHSGIGNQIGNYVFGQFLFYIGAVEYKETPDKNNTNNIGLRFLFLEDETIDRTFVLNKFDTNLIQASKEDVERFLKAGADFHLYFSLINNIKYNKKEYFNSFYKVLTRIRTKYHIYPFKTPALMAKTVSYRDILKIVSNKNLKPAKQKKLIGNVAVCDCYSPIKEFYNQDFREKMKEHFTLKEELDEKNSKVLEKIKACENSVGVHIRRGDYIGLKIPVVKKEFILEKMRILNEKFNDKKDAAQFFIFSDGIDWAKENLIESGISNLHFININDENHGYLDFSLLNTCCHRIYSASSFSSWAQYLNPYKNSIEFYPEKKDLVIE